MLLYPHDANAAYLTARGDIPRSKFISRSLEAFFKYRLMKKMHT
jgi:hypothetical protein